MLNPVLLWFQLARLFAYLKMKVLLTTYYWLFVNIIIIITISWPRLTYLSNSFFLKTILYCFVYIKLFYVSKLWRCEVISNKWLYTHTSDHEIWTGTSLLAIGIQANVYWRVSGNKGLKGVIKDSKFAKYPVYIFINSCTEGLEASKDCLNKWHSVYVIWYLIFVIKFLANTRRL